MMLEELERHILRKFEAETDHPIEGDKSVTIFRRADNKKWFAATKNIGCRFVDVDRPGRIDILNLRLDPRLVARLRMQEGFRPAWRMNQNSWVTVLLDGSVANEVILDYLDQAYDGAGVKSRTR